MCKLLEKYMTLWGECERMHMQSKEWLHAHDCHQNVTETSGHQI